MDVSLSDRVTQDRLHRVLAAPDKFKGTASAHEASHAIARAARRAGWKVRECPLADGGDGMIEVFGGANRLSTVTGPLGIPVEAGWRLDGDFAVIETARTSGLVIAGGKERNDPSGATTRGAGEIIAEAMRCGARHIIVGVGGSATTDGGLGAVEALQFGSFLSHVTVDVACDVDTMFLDAASVFGPQKGADAGLVARLSVRLVEVADRYRKAFGVDVTKAPRAGAAGGLAGGLFALGAHLESGFALVARALGFDDALSTTDLVVTGEGRLDVTSFEGKVVGGVCEYGRALDIPVLVIAGAIANQVPEGFQSISLTERFGEQRALSEATTCIEEAAYSFLAERF